MSNKPRCASTSTGAPSLDANSSTVTYWVLTGNNESDLLRKIIAKPWIACRPANTQFQRLSLSFLEAAFLSFFSVVVALLALALFSVFFADLVADFFVVFFVVDFLAVFAADDFVDDFLVVFFVVLAFLALVALFVVAIISNYNRQNGVIS